MGKEKETHQPRPKGSDKSDWRRVFQIEGTAGAKAEGQEWGKCKASVVGAE